MAVEGKGFMIWQAGRCEGGSGADIAKVAKAAGLSHVLIKVADGPYTYNVDKTTKKDLVPSIVQELHARGLQAWGWQYIYGYNPAGEAQIAVQRIKQLGLDGFCIDAEGEYKTPGRDAAAKTYMSGLRKSLPNLPIGLCSYRFPTLHPQLPWKEFLDRCDYNMPQVYWQAAHNAGAQLRRCVREFQSMSPFRPILPVGPVYRYGSWEPTQADMIEYLQTAVALNLKATSFFAWDYGRSNLKVLWDTISAFPWSGSSTSKEMPQKYIDALNLHDPAKTAQLYWDDAVLITAAQTVQGKPGVQNYFNTFLNKTLANAVYKMTGISGAGGTRHFTWTASAAGGKIQNGSDTIGIMNNQIVYHYTHFTVSKA